MTANRSRRVGHIEKGALVEIFLTGSVVPGTGPLGGYRPPARPQHIWTPPTDVYETEDKIVVLVEVAGVAADDFSVTLHDRFLRISGVRRDQFAGRRAYHRMEVHFGEFNTEVELPQAVDEETIEAEYGDGFLRLVFVKSECTAI